MNGLNKEAIARVCIQTQHTELNNQSEIYKKTKECEHNYQTSENNFFLSFFLSFFLITLLQLKTIKKNKQKEKICRSVVISYSIYIFDTFI